LKKRDDVKLVTTPAYPDNKMPDGLWQILILIAIVIVYVVAKIVGYMRQSEEQWQQVDKSKLREWEDDE
jgi:multisubunit Na+/H+ antiporter MnhC subunit